MRLYPLHWLSLLLLLALWALFEPRHVDAGTLTLNALLLQAWSPVHEVHYSFNTVSWYLSALLFCYLCFPFAVRLLSRWRLRYQLLLLAVLAVVLGMVVLPLDIPGREAVHVNPLSHLLDLCVGITLLRVYRLMKPRCAGIGYAGRSCIEVGALVLLVVSWCLNRYTSLVHPWEDNLLWIVPQSCLILTCALLDGREGILGRLLLCKPLQWLGGISFELFMLQFVAFLLANYVVSPVLGHWGINSYDQMIWIALPLLVVLSWAVNRWFTQPVRMWLRQKGC